MPQTKHTPGPWIVGSKIFNNHDPQHVEIRADGDSGAMRALIAKAFYGATIEDTVANARLIAASPSLYALVASLAREGDSRAAKLLDSLGMS